MAAGMLEHGIGRRDVERIVVKRQPCIRFDLHVTAKRKSRLEPDTFAEPASRDLVLMRVASLQHVGAVVDHVGHADIQDLVRRGRLHLGDEILVDAVARRDQQLFRRAPGRHFPVILLIDRHCPTFM